jgi:hypothetical protein
MKLRGKDLRFGYSHQLEGILCRARLQVNVHRTPLPHEGPRSSSGCVRAVEVRSTPARGLSRRCGCKVVSRQGPNRTGLRTHDFMPEPFPENISANLERRGAGDVS